MCCQPESFIFFPRPIVFAFNCGIKNTPEQDPSWSDPYLWPSPSLSAVYLISDSGSVIGTGSGMFFRSPLTLSGRGRVNGFDLFAPSPRTATGGHENDLRLDYWVTKCEDIKSATEPSIEI